MGGGIEREGNKKMHRKERKKRRNGQRRREKQKDPGRYTEKKKHILVEKAGGYPNLGEYRVDWVWTVKF